MVVAKVEEIAVIPHSVLLVSDGIQLPKDRRATSSGSNS
jgi:hypothetical protein